MALEEINVGSVEVPRLLSIAKDLMPSEKKAMTELLQEFKNDFTWSHEDMKGMDPKLYQHKINLLGHKCETCATTTLSHEPKLHGTRKRRI